jgi:hypothetical protein
MVVCVVQLEHADAEYLASILEPFLSPEGSMVPYVTTNVVIIKDRQTNELRSFWPKTSPSAQNGALTAKSAIDSRKYIAFAHYTLPHVELTINSVHITKFSI